MLYLLFLYLFIIKKAKNYLSKRKQKGKNGKHMYIFSYHRFLLIFDSFFFLQLQYTDIFASVYLNVVKFLGLV